LNDVKCPKDYGNGTENPTKHSNYGDKSLFISMSILSLTLSSADYGPTGKAHHHKRALLPTLPAQLKHKQELTANEVLAFLLFSPREQGHSRFKSLVGQSKHAYCTAFR